MAPEAQEKDARAFVARGRAITLAPYLAWAGLREDSKTRPVAIQPKIGPASKALNMRAMASLPVISIGIHNSNRPAGDTGTSWFSSGGTIRLPMGEGRDGHPSTFLRTVALAAMGLETDVSKIYAQGLRPAILGALAFLFIATFSLALIELMG